jgi:hypothetical protein
MQFNYPEASIKDAQATGETFSSQKRTSITLKDENSVFFVFWGHFCPPGSGSGSAICMLIRIRIQQLKLMLIRFRIRIRIQNPDCIGYFGYRFVIFLFCFLELVHHRETHFKCPYRKCVFACGSIPVLRIHLRSAHARY